MQAAATPEIPLPAPRPRGRPKAKDLEELERRLITIARQMFLAHGYGATSMAAVARHARISKNTLYARFGSKAALFGAIMSDQIGKTDWALGRVAANLRHLLEDRLRSYIEHMFRASLGGDMLQMNRLVYSESARFPELGRAASERKHVGAGQVSDMLVQAAERDGIPCRHPERAATMLIMLTRGWYGDLLLRNSQPGGPELRALADDIVRFFVAGRADW